MLRKNTGVPQLKEIILLKQGEIVLKGLNKRMFESVLIDNIKRRLKAFGKFNIYSMQSTIYVEPVINETNPNELNLNEINLNVTTTLPFTYQFGSRLVSMPAAPGGVSIALDNISAGSHSITVTTSCGSKTVSFTISNCLAPEVELINVTNSAGGDGNGSAIFRVTYPHAYTYQINGETPITGPDATSGVNIPLTGLSAGTYTIKVWYGSRYKELDFTIELIN